MSRALPVIAIEVVRLEAVATCTNESNVTCAAEPFVNVIVVEMISSLSSPSILTVFKLAAPDNVSKLLPTLTITSSPLLRGVNSPSPSSICNVVVALKP